MLIAKVPLQADALKHRLLHWASTSPRYPFFKGSSKDLSGWFRIIESACEENEVSQLQYTDVALLFIEGDLAHVMKERQFRYLENSKSDFWRWEDFKDDIGRVVVEAERIAAEETSTPLDKAKDAVVEFRREHPHIVASASVGLMVGGSLVLLPMLGILALNAIGFTGGGVAAGSLAAMLQSIFYGGATGGLFSLCQSIAATAVLPAAGAVVGAASAVGTGVASLVYGARGNDVSDDARGARSPSPSNSNFSEHSELPPPYNSISGSRQVPVNYAVYTPRRQRG